MLHNYISAPARIPERRKHGGTLSPRLHQPNLHGMPSTETNIETKRYKPTAKTDIPEKRMRHSVRKVRKSTAFATGFEYFHRLLARTFHEFA